MAGTSTRLRGGHEGGKIPVPRWRWNGVGLLTGFSPDLGRIKGKRVTSGTSKAGSQWDVSHVTFDQLLFLQILYLSLEMKKKQSFINTRYPVYTKGDSVQDSEMKKYCL